MNFSVKKAIVVPKDLATLGYVNERTDYPNTNHREVCKFLLSEDPNCVAIRNAPASAIVGLKNMSRLKTREVDSEKRQWVRGTLEAEDACSEDYERATSLRMYGSCRWIAEKDAVQNCVIQPNHQWIGLRLK